MTNKINTVLYIGVTRDLKRRVWQHQQKAIPGFTARYNVTKLVYYEVFEDVRDAIQREKQLKNWKRQWKVNLISLVNPIWKDISNFY